MGEFTARATSAHRCARFDQLPRQSSAPHVEHGPPCRCRNTWPAQAGVEQTHVSCDRPRRGGHRPVMNTFSSTAARRAIRFVPPPSTSRARRSTARLTDSGLRSPRKSWPRSRGRPSGCALQASRLDTLLTLGLSHVELRRGGTRWTARARPRCPPLRRHPSPGLSGFTALIMKAFGFLSVRSATIVQTRALSFEKLMPEGCLLTRSPENVCSTRSIAPRASQPWPKMRAIGRSAQASHHLPALEPVDVRRCTPGQARASRSGFNLKLLGAELFPRSPRTAPR
jgi:hypothetical protein